METAAQRFIRYVGVNTQSDEFSETCPSTPGQRDLGRMLVDEMQAMGISDVYMDENGYVYGTVPGDPTLPTVGLIAHMDTAPDCYGEHINHRTVLYNGGDILLNAEKNIVMKEKDFPSLKDDMGKHLIVTDGTTLLGADDKAGVAEIMACAEYLLTSKCRHATLKIGFTPDEEIGRGADLFDVEGFGADYAYTVDGGALGEIEYENFNAAGAVVTVNGLSIHPGGAKDKMINAQNVAIEFHNLLPETERPEHTEGYEGFFHLTDMKGCVEQAVLRYIIRDHDPEKFEEKKEMMRKIENQLNDRYRQGTVSVSIKDSYYNMRQKIEPCMHIVDRAKKAMEQINIAPVCVPIRGGTDGARLSYMGLPCPNLCTGGKNFHGPFEYIAVEDMQKVTELLVQVLTLF